MTGGFLVWRVFFLQSLGRQTYSPASELIIVQIFMPFYIKWVLRLLEFRNLSKFTFQKKLKSRFMEILIKNDHYYENTQITNAML